jgi:Fe-S cluster biogenesis protein NfuA
MSNEMGTSMILNREEIAAVLTERITPLLEVDGASLELVDFDDENRRLHVRFGGAYRGSPCRETVVKHVIEPVLKQAFADLVTVEWLD